jgi:hypothetical protein
MLPISVQSHIGSKAHPAPIKNENVIYSNLMVDESRKYMVWPYLVISA